MTDDLAEVLLARAMAWGPDEVTAERPYLQVLARYKYDEYEQYSPGRRFLESLALWLWQFETKDERTKAYRFVRDRLVFISSPEMQSLVSTCYPDLMQGILLQRIANELKLPDYKLSTLLNSKEFRVLKRQSLFVGLSDGAHTDVFRRSNRSEITHEQVYQTYEISESRAEKMLVELRNELRAILKREPTESESRFKMLFLLDDFCGSGRTYIREKDGKFTGKITSVYSDATSQSGSIARLIDLSHAEVYVVVYIGTQQAVTHLDNMIAKLWSKDYTTPQIRVLHSLGPESGLFDPQDADILSLSLTPKYYDPDVEDTSTRVGGDNVRLGFGDCRLPIVLHHNTPNNAIALLWSYEQLKFRGLFPRVPRHREIT